MRVDGVVLAGGRSRRFGSDKRFAEVDGSRLLDIAVGKLASVVTGGLYVAGGTLSAGLEGGRRPQAGVDAWLRDDPCAGGPLGGVIAALSRSRYGVLVLACDMPSVRTATLAALASVGARTRRAVAPRCVRGWEPLVAYYPGWMLALLRSAVAGGVRAPHRILDACGALPLPAWREAEFVNINRPADFSKIRM